jgi:hypothetical protein
MTDVGDMPITVGMCETHLSPAPAMFAMHHAALRPYFHQSELLDTQAYLRLGADATREK